MSNSLVQALIAHFGSVFEGPNGDYPAVLEALAGITVSQAIWKPAPKQNSIWEIVDHLKASKLWQIDILEKGQATPPIWTQPTGMERDWQMAIKQLGNAHAQLKDSLGHLSEKVLLTVPEPMSKQTLLELLLSIAAHEAHHGGQIDYLRGLQTGTGP